MWPVAGCRVRIAPAPRVHNHEVEAEAVLAPHIAATFKRAREVPLCLVVHDTTELKFSGRAERDGLGLLTGTRWPAI